MPTSAEQAIDDVVEVIGRHPGCRALHAEGIVLTGTFTARPGPAALSRAPTLLARASYAPIPDYGLHAFRCVKTWGAEHCVRYTLSAHAGVLETGGLDSERERGDDVLVFDPSRVVTGASECSEDPVLRFRPSAYAKPIRRRTAG